jgi:hypothetical protein
MALATCPWMAARCPHYISACNDAESKHCFYVKNSSRTAFLALTQMTAQLRQLAVPNPELQRKIEETREFLDSMRE